MDTKLTGFGSRDSILEHLRELRCWGFLHGNWHQMQSADTLKMPFETEKHILSIPSRGTKSSVAFPGATETNKQVPSLHNPGSSLTWISPSYSFS